MHSVGITVGRFQPFHNGHVELIKKMLSENDTNIVFITKHLNSFEKYSYDKRYDMIMEKFGNELILKATEDINVKDPSQWYLYILGKISMMTDILKVNITWYAGDDVNYLISNNTRINLDFKKIKRETNISGTMIRKLISENKWNDVKKHVPNSTYQIIKPKSKEK